MPLFPMPDTPFMLGANGMVVDIALNGMASAGKATAGMVPNIATGESSNTNVPSPGPWAVSQLLSGSVVQLSGNGAYTIPTGISPQQAVGSQGGYLLGGSQGSMQVDFSLTNVTGLQGVAMLVGNVGPTTLYVGIYMDGGSPGVVVTDTLGTQIFNVSYGLVAANMQVQLFWNATGFAAAYANGQVIGISDFYSGTPWTPFVPTAILYGTYANGFNSFVPFLGTLHKLQISNNGVPKAQKFI